MRGAFLFMFCIQISIALSSARAFADIDAEAPVVAETPAPLKCKYETDASTVPDKAPYKKIALTFDDGPDPELTPVILDILKKYKIKAAFFLVGANIIGNEKLVQREVAEGHFIGNHTFDHPHLPTLTPPDVLSEMLKTQLLLKPFLQKRQRIIRFPYGESSCVAEKTAENMHLNIVGWHVDSCDWSFGAGLPNTDDCVDPQDLRDKYRNDYEGWLEYQLDKTHGGIILMHDVQSFTAQHLESLIKRFIKEGYKFTTLDSGNFPKLMSDHSQVLP